MVQVDKMEDTLSTRDADIEAELAETTTSIEEIKNSIVSVETNVIGICKEHTNVKNKIFCTSFRNTVFIYRKLAIFLRKWQKMQHGP